MLTVEQRKRHVECTIRRRARREFVSDVVLALALLGTAYLVFALIWTWGAK
jgi:hypothetical protein